MPQSILITGDRQTIDTNEFEQRETLTKCREIFLSLKDEDFAEVIDATADLDTVTERIREAVERSVS